MLVHGAAGGVGSIAVQLAREIARRLQEGQLRPIIGEVRPLDDAVAAFAAGHRIAGKTIIAVAESVIDAHPGAR